jgi:regulation of enolase protein 1 (concanavalin A-like superfamily)
MENIGSIVGKNMEECLAKMNEDLGNLAEWLNYNKLKLNVDKTKFMIITSKRTDATTNKIYGETIQRAPSMKYLGVTIDQKFTFKEHMAMVTKKMSSKVGFLGRLSRKLSTHTPKQ